jgi:predicted metal-dependent hydrolase
LNNNELLVSTYLDNPSGRILRFLKEQARKNISELAYKKADIIDKEIKSIQIRDTKSRWGSCGQNKRLSFSWRLILSPPESLDYVVAHEVAHLVHMNHTRKFWTLCEELSYDYINGKSWMREHGNSLMRFG